MKDNVNHQGKMLSLLKIKHQHAQQITIEFDRRAEEGGGS